MEIYTGGWWTFLSRFKRILNFFLQRFYIYALRYFCEVQVENLDSRLTCIIICKHHSTFNKHNTGFPLHYSPYPRDFPGFPTIFQDIFKSAIRLSLEKKTAAVDSRWSVKSCKAHSCKTHEDYALQWLHKDKLYVLINVDCQHKPYSYLYLYNVVELEIGRYFITLRDSVT